MLRVLPVLLLVGLTVYAAIDCLLTERRRVRHLPRAAWVLVILLVPVAGPAAWLLAGRRPQPPATDRGRPARPLAPDDDPDFLRGLGRRGLEEWKHTDGHRTGPDDEGDDDTPPPHRPSA